jgi:hypothetical protein
MKSLSGQVLAGASYYPVSHGAWRKRWRLFMKNMKKWKKAPDLFPPYPIA